MSESDRGPKPAAPMPSDVESLLRQRDELDRVIREQFQRRVAVIFTDIQGSTQYFERYGDLAGRAMVQRHNDLLFPLIAETGGRVVKTIGDAIMAFFENSASAVQASIRMQRALAEKNEVWPERERINIRIGVHVGEALVDSADVYGDTVNTAARIEAQANGGEILISDAVKAELGAGAPGLRARGAVKLRGKAAEVPLFEVRWRDREPVSVAVAVQSRKGRWVAIGGAAVVLLAGAGFGVRALLGHRSAPPAMTSSGVASAGTGSTTAPSRGGTEAVVTTGGTAPAAAPGSAAPGSVAHGAVASGPNTSGSSSASPSLASATTPATASRTPASATPGPTSPGPVAPAATPAGSTASREMTGSAEPSSSTPKTSRSASHAKEGSTARIASAGHHRSSATHERTNVEPAKHEAAAPTGTVRIHVFPFADVFIDGKQVGKGTRDVKVTIPIGAHHLRLVNPAFPEKKLTLHVAAGLNEEQDYSLTP